MLLNKWNYQTHKYDKVEIPNCYNCKTYSNNMKELVHCPHCEDIQAVLDELENRIPSEAIEKKIQEYKGLKEIDMQAYEEQIKPLKELLNKE